jgi:hypothetical protein
VSDWRQIQARIRKARTSADPPGQLAALYERTRDAMVAFELAQIHEKAGTNTEAARWYTAAAERFRRAQWKLKAEEALTRLGAPIPVAPAAASVSETSPEPATRLEPIITEFTEVHVSEVTGEPDGGQQEEVFEQPAAAAAPTTPQAAGEVPGHRRKRRGRRGGRGRYKGARTAGAPVAQVASAPVPIATPSTERALEPRSLPGIRPFVSEEFSERRARSVDQAEDAPAGPGVFLITDTDQTCYYYIEACQTLRVGIGNLLRSGRGSREGANLKEKLAEHLGINEARVGKYLKDHCCVRWLQLDEGAPLLAHFAVAVLRPVANE